MSSQNRLDYVEVCKQENADFIKYFNPLIVYIREPGVAVYDRKDLTAQPKIHRGRPVGVVVTYTNEDGQLCQGWSKCNFKSGDKWNRQIGLHKAIRGCCSFWSEQDLRLDNSPNTKWKKLLGNSLLYSYRKWLEIKKKKQEKAEGDIHSFSQLNSPNDTFFAGRDSVNV